MNRFFLLCIAAAVLAMPLASAEEHDFSRPKIIVPPHATVDMSIQLNGIHQGHLTVNNGADCLLEVNKGWGVNGASKAFTWTNNSEFPAILWISAAAAIKEKDPLIAQPHEAFVTSKPGEALVGIFAYTDSYDPNNPAKPLDYVNLKAAFKVTTKK